MDHTVVEIKEFDSNAMHRRVLSNSDSIVISENGGVQFNAIAA
jgi:hypothetical protein